MIVYQSISILRHSCVEKELMVRYMAVYEVKIILNDNLFYEMVFVLKDIDIFLVVLS